MRIFAGLVWELCRRELQARYIGTVLGRAWFVIPPLLLLLLYSFVFHQILNFRFESGASPHASTLYLFVGLTAFNAFAHVLISAPTVLIDKRDVLLNAPVSAAVLPLVPVVVSVVVEWIAIGLLLVWLMWQGVFEWRALWFYGVWCLLRVGLSVAFAYLLAVLGVFLRDLKQLIQSVVSVVLFSAPIVYPLSAVSESWAAWLRVNPLTALVEGYRFALLDGVFAWAQWGQLAIWVGVCLVVAWMLFEQLMPRARYVL